MRETLDAAPAESKALALYALITLSVVLATVDRYTPFELAAVVLGQALSLTLAHAYADSVAHRASLVAGLWHALPVMVVALPSLFITLVGGLAGMEGETTVYIAEFVNLAGLVSLQGLSARRIGFAWPALVSALLLDLVAITTVVLVIVFLK